MAYSPILILACLGSIGYRLVRYRYWLGKFYQSISVGFVCWWVVEALVNATIATMRPLCVCTVGLYVTLLALTKYTVITIELAQGCPKGRLWSTSRSQRLCRSNTHAPKNIYNTIIGDLIYWHQKSLTAQTHNAILCFEHTSSIISI